METLSAVMDRDRLHEPALDMLHEASEEELISLRPFSSGVIG
jgi:hypothetical protein